MLSSYKPYPIYDFKSGLRLDKAPWLSPADSFETFLDWFIYQGVMKKRGGTSAFATFANVNPSKFGEGKFGAGKFGVGRVETNPGNAIMGIFSYFKGITEQLLIFDTKRLNKYNTVTAECDDRTTLQMQFKTGVKEIVAGSTITGLTSGDTATVDAVVLDNGAYADGDAHGTLILSGAAEGDFDSDGETLQVSAVTVAASKESATYGDLTGSDADFIWFENWRDVGYITNNVDQIRKYNGSYLTKFTIDLDVVGGPDNDVSAGLLIFHLQGRVLLLRTTERGEVWYQRARYSRVAQRGQAVVFDDADYIDAPRDDMIMGADFIGSDLIIFFERGAMKLQYTTDADTPFKWVDIPSQEGIYATMSIAPFSSELIGVGPTRFIATDGREVYGIDEKIPDFMLSFNQLAVNYCYSLVIEELKLVLTSYPAETATKPNRTLMLNFDENHYSVYSLAGHVFGYSSLETTLALDDMVGIRLDDLNYSLDDKELKAGYPTTLMGNRDGTVVKMNDGSTDLGVGYTADGKSARLNPFFQEQYKAVLGYIDFMVTRNASASFQVANYINTEAAPFQTRTVNCTETGTSRKLVIKRVAVNAEGDFHRLQLLCDGVGPEIHAIIPWFKRGARLF